MSAATFAWLRDVRLDLAVATLSEGYCPQCGGRLHQEVDEDFDFEDQPAVGLFAQGGCRQCDMWMRAGTPGNAGGDWITFTMHHPKGGAVLTMALNPPDDDDDDDDWEEIW